MKEGFNLVIDLFKGSGDPSQAINMKEFLNFIKTPPFLNKDHISLVGMKHEILTKKVVEDIRNDLDKITAEELLKAGDRLDYLKEALKAGDFYDTCKANKVNISMWEVFVVFAHINQQSRTEPDRYHLCHVDIILETLNQEDVWNAFEEIELEKRRIIEERNKKKNDANPRKSLNNRFDDNNEEEEEEEKEAKIKPAKKRLDEEESDLFDRNQDEEDDLDDEEDHPGLIGDDDDDEIDLIIQNKDKLNKKQPQKIEENKSKAKKDIPKPAPKGNKDSADFMIGKQTQNTTQGSGDKSTKIKHIFSIKVLELMNVAILKKVINDLNREDRYSQTKQEGKYIQDVFVKYIFPLDDEQIVSDYIEFEPKQGGSFDYKVSMHSFHSYVLEPDKSIGESLAKIKNND